MPPYLVATRRRLLLAGALLLLLVPLFLAVPTHLRQDVLIGPLGDRYHVALFLVLTVLLHRHGPLRGRLLAVVATCLGVGAATELLQLLAGRSATIWDSSTFIMHSLLSPHVKDPQIACQFPRRSYSCESLGDSRRASPERRGS